MHAESTILALIPARGGSKGLPGKNIRQCAGKPLIQWTITAALECESIDDVVVTTDSAEIADVARRGGASVPFLRPADLAADESSMLDVISHAWETHLDRNGKRFDYIVLLQPTSPLRTSAQISEAIGYYFDHRLRDDDTLASVYPVSQKYGWLLETSDDSGYIRFCMGVSGRNPQRQALGQYYLPNGAIFILSGCTVADGIYRQNTIPFVMAASESIDIDSAEDFADAESILAKRNSE